MAESLERVNAECLKYELHSSESQLLANYYSVLLGEAGPLEKPFLFKAANAARKIASMWTDLPETIRCKLVESADTPICCAARVMYYVAELLADADYSPHWFREASVAYLQSGNIPGCASTWERYLQTSATTDPADWVINALLGLPGDVPRAIRRITPECITAPWRAADPEFRRESQRALYELSCDSKYSLFFDKSLAYRLSNTLALLGAMSLDSLLSAAGMTLPSWYRRALIRDKRMLLMPSQVPAVQHWCESQGNMVLCTPTSTGKTFVAEIAIVLELCRNTGIAVFVTPYRAVARGIVETLRTRLEGSDISVIAAYGDEPVQWTEGTAVVVGTPEKIDGLLTNNPDFMGSARIVVIDEIHLVNQRTRGVFFEAFISRIILEQRLTGLPARILGISAVVDNPSELAAWLGVQTAITSRWRPNPIVQAYWTDEDHLLLHDINSPSDDPTFWEYADFLPEMPRWPSRFVRQEGMENALRLPLGARCSWYSRTWSEKTGSPVLVICSSRTQTREFASITAANMTADSDPMLEETAAQIDGEHPYLTLLTHCLRRGIAYHNAALPSEVRHKIEDLLNKRVIRIVYATTTLAEGADFPFRAVVIAAPAHFDADLSGYSAMSPLLLRNIAGRGGRTSGQLIGDVVQMYSPHSMADSEGATIGAGQIFLKYLVDPRNCVIRSALEAGISESTRSRTTSELFSAFDRVIYRWQDRENAVNEYRHVFLGRIMRSQLGSRLEADYENVMQQPAIFGEALAMRASPLRLTELGTAVLFSGFAVSSAQIIWTTIQERGWFTSAADPVEIVEACSGLGGKIPEVTELRSTTRRPLKDENVGAIFEALSNGEALADAYLLAEEAAGEGIRRAARHLVRGEASVDDSVHARFEVFVDELKRKLLFEIPTVAKAMKIYIEYRGQVEDLSGFEYVLSMSEKLRRVID